MHVETVHPVTISENGIESIQGDGYYLDADGQRHACSVVLDGLEPGAQVQVRSPVIPVSPPTLFYKRSEAVSIFVIAVILGILFGGMLVWAGLIALLIEAP
ncbi:hypothetical protein ACFRAQ_27610 [Nocardia sp. NPDC056611]|uniref:hypothetical protein n=1 Tax=Nocardia sp. NPDC056611 TaxID=3345877 RepID=UPI00366CAE02